MVVTIDQDHLHITMNDLYITIAATGNAIDFGDLTSSVDRQNYSAAMASPTRGVFGASGDHPNQINNINLLLYQL